MIRSWGVEVQFGLRIENDMLSWPMEPETRKKWFSAWCDVRRTYGGKRVWWPSCRLVFLGFWVGAGIFLRLERVDAAPASGVKS